MSYFRPSLEVKQADRGQLNLRTGKSRSIIARVAKEAKLCTVKDMKTHADAVEQANQDAVTGHRTTNTMVVPVKVDDKVIGVVQISNKYKAEPGNQKDFDKSDLDVVEVSIYDPNPNPNPNPNPSTVTLP